MKAICLPCFLIAGLVLTYAKPALSSSCSLNAGGTSCDAYNDAGSSPVYDSAPKQVGNTVDIATGNNYRGVLDFKTADSFLSFKRHYNSVNAGFNVGLGGGWRSTYDVSLIFSDKDNLYVVQSDGRIIGFQATQAGSQQKVTNAESVLFKSDNPSDGVITRQGAYHVWQLPDKRSLNFKGRFLTHIDFGTGHSLKLFYRNQRLSTVTDEKGRQLRYQYTEGNGLGTYQPGSEYTAHPGHLESITLPDDKTIEFYYDQYRNLRKVIQSDESAMEYEYQEGLYSGFVVAEAIDNSIQQEWTYHSDGTVASYSDNKNAVEMKLSYHENGDDPLTGYTLVTGKKGNTYQYHWKKSQKSNDSTGAFHFTSAQITSATGNRCIGCPVIDSTKNSFDEETDNNSIVYPSSLVSRLEELNGRVQTTDVLGYPVKVEFVIDGASSAVDFDFSARGKLNSITAIGKDNSTIKATLNWSKETRKDSLDKQPTKSKPSGLNTNNEIYPLAEFLFELAYKLDNAGEFRTANYKGQSDDNSAATTMPPAPTGLVDGQSTPGNPPLCTQEADCDAIDRAMFYFDFSHCAYVANRPCNNSVPEGWVYVDPLEAGLDGSADISELTHDLEFDAAIFYNEEENRIIIAYSGSDHISDFVAGEALASGGESYQGETAIDLALVVEELYPDATIETTGHSLGGGLAILAASRLSIGAEENVEGVVFGSIGIDQETAEAYDVPWETTDLIDHFYVEEDTIGDPPSWHMSISQSDIGLVYESNRYLPARAVTYELSQPTGQASDTGHPHRMGSIADALENHHNDLECD